MPSIIQFGDGTPVAELDFGLPGGVLHSSWPIDGAYATMEIAEGEVKAAVQDAAMPDINIVATQRGGFHGQVLAVSGTINAKDHATMNTIISNIRAREFSPDLMIPTVLNNNTTGETLSEVTLRRFRPTARRVAAGGTIVMDYRFEFHIHRRPIV
ncbi:MAG TPA: hypothetical protein ENI79_06375 [Rhodospirillales bacterium]|nr:hypothetical protein [Rhodospirillales bacterium]